MGFQQPAYKKAATVILNSEKEKASLRSQLSDFKSAYQESSSEKLKLAASLAAEKRSAVREKQRVVQEAKKVSASFDRKLKEVQQAAVTAMNQAREGTDVAKIAHHSQQMASKAIHTMANADREGIEAQHAEQ